jgi:hypothetical protein
MTVQPSAVRGSGGGGLLAGLAFGPALRTVLSLELRQVFGIDQADSVGPDGGDVALLDVPPQHYAGHPDLASRLRDRQQPSLPHAGKGSQPATSVTGYTCCEYRAKECILVTRDSGMEVQRLIRTSCRLGRMAPFTPAKDFGP